MQARDWKWMIISWMGFCFFYPAGVAAEDPAVMRAADKHEIQGDEFYKNQRWREAHYEWAWAIALDPQRRYLTTRIRQAENGGLGDGQAYQAVSPAAAPDNDMQRYIQQANEKANFFYAQSQLKDAESMWRQIIMRDAGNELAGYGLESIRQEQYEAGAEHPFEQMTQALYEEGMIAFRKKDWSTAIVKFTEGIKLNPKQSQLQTYLRKANTAYQKDRMQATFADMLQEAAAAEKTQAWLEAFRLWNNMLAINPEYSFAQQGLIRSRAQLTGWAKNTVAAGETEMAKDQYQAASDYFKQVISVFPDQAAAQKGITRAQAKLQEGQLQAEQNRTGLKHYNQGVAYYQQGELVKAAAEWKMAVAACPAEPAYQEWYQRACQAASENQQLNRVKAEESYQAGLKGYQNGDFEQAKDCWKKTLRLDPTHEKAAKNLKKLEETD